MQGLDCPTASRSHVVLLAPASAGSALLTHASLSECFGHGRPDLKTLDGRKFM